MGRLVLFFLNIEKKSLQNTLEHYRTKYLMRKTFEWNICGANFTLKEGLKTGSQNLENLEKQNKLVHGIKKCPLIYVS